MKKIMVLLFSLALAACVSVFTFAGAEGSAEDAVKDPASYSLARATVELTADGVVISQTEMGTPDNHAIAILEVPFTSTEDVTVKFSVNMDEFVASGRSANDVWAGIGVMGKPTFINWRNVAEDEESKFSGYGLAKDSPGLFTRFFNYSGDLRYESSVYHGGYKTAGDDPSSQTVDTWQLISGNANVSAKQDITFRLAYDGVSQGKGFYNIYINGKNVTENGEASFMDKDVLFPDGKLYLVFAMNTQQSEFNSLSKITVKEVNGVAYRAEGSGENGKTSSDKKGCSGGLTGAVGVLAAAAFVGGFALKKKEEK